MLGFYRTHDKNEPKTKSDKIYFASKVGLGVVLIGITRVFFLCK
jgi:hypothetical protein